MISDKDILCSIKMWMKDTFSGLSKIAFSGKYADLCQKPTAKDVGALPSTGGMLNHNGASVLSLNNAANNETKTELYFLLNDKIIAILTGKQIGGFDLYDAVNKKVLLGVTNNYLKYKNQKVLVEGDISTFQPGEVFSIKSDTPFAGYVTTSASALFFTVPLPKSAEGRTVDIVCPHFRVRGIQGYIVNMVDISDYIIYQQAVSENLLKLNVRKKDFAAFDNAVNNTPIGVDGDFTITFS